MEFTILTAIPLVKFRFISLKDIQEAMFFLRCVLSRIEQMVLMLGSRNVFTTGRIVVGNIVFNGASLMIGNQKLKYL